MDEPAPNGPLLGDELQRATELLTVRQLTAYHHRRDNHSLNWIAARMGVTRPRVVHLVAAAEKRLGYAPSVTPKQKAPYKPAARRREESEAALDAYLDGLIAGLEPSQRLIEILETATSVEERDRLLRERLAELERERQAHEHPADDDWSMAAGQGEAEFFASLAEDGFTRADGEALRPGEFIEDDGKGYDSL
jgi:DNA-binding CsgD family transcriptional regulator